jgi:hypothetical protein
VTGWEAEPISCDTGTVDSALLVSPATNDVEDVPIVVVSMLPSEVRSTEEVVIMSLLSEAVEMGFAMLVLSKPPLWVELLDHIVREGDSSALIAVVVSIAGLPPRSSLKLSIVSGVT